MVGDHVEEHIRKLRAEGLGTLKIAKQAGCGVSIVQRVLTSRSPYARMLFHKTRTSRLEPCSCGSGRRFRDCHGKLDQQLVATPFEARHGAVQPLISTSFAGRELNIRVATQPHVAAFITDLHAKDPRMRAAGRVQARAQQHLPQRGGRAWSGASRRGWRVLALCGTYPSCHPPIYLTRVRWARNALKALFPMKKPRSGVQSGLLRSVSGGNGGIRTLDEALHPILP